MPAGAPGYPGGADGPGENAAPVGDGLSCELTPEYPVPGGYALPVTPGYGGGLFDTNTEFGGGWSGKV